MLVLMVDSEAKDTRRGCPSDLQVQDFDSFDHDEFCKSRCKISRECVDLASEFNMMKFKYCPREANQDSHEIAKSSFLNKSSCIWIDEPPSFLISTIINDVTTLCF
jgi:hypothetical protein